MTLKIFGTLFICLTLASCVSTSTTSLERDRAPVYTTTISRSQGAFRNCLVPRMESYDLLNGFSFEDRTLQVDVRDVAGGIDLYQKNGSFIMTYVKLRGNAATLYLHPGISSDRWTHELSGFINSCR